jgi:hypothetical protein
VKKEHPDGPAQSAGLEGIPATISDPRGIDHRNRYHFNEAVGLRATITPDWPQSKKIPRLDSRLVLRLGAPFSTRSRKGLSR